MSDNPAPPPQRLLAARLQFARAALWWERVWPAAWPALCVLATFAVLALFDLLPLLPGWAHAAVLAAFALAFVTAIAAGARAVASSNWPDRFAARRRIERASGLAHRPLAALADRPGAPLDEGAAQLWAAHRLRMAGAVRRLRVGWPAASLARRDPLGLRSLLTILLLLGAIDAGADWPDRVVHALVPQFDSGTAAVAASFDLWLTPPDYTGLPPLFLRAGQKEIVRVPTGSVLLAQVHGGDALPRLAIDGKARKFAAVDAENFRFTTKLTSGRELTLRQDGGVLGSWPIAIIPDLPPTVAFARKPTGTPRAVLRLDYRASDDYGVEGVKAVITREHDHSGARIVLDLPLPGLHLKQADATSYHDLSSHPWAGLPVAIRLVATDALGQTGESLPAHIVLPERVFHNPVAKAIIDERKELAKDPDSADAVAEILGDLNERPELYRNDAVVFLALRLAQDQLRQDHGAAAITAVERLLWNTALRIEDGSMSLAERELRQIEQKLQDALARNAPDSEINQLMQRLRQALDRYMQALATQLLQHPNAINEPFDPSRMLTSRDLERLLDRAQQLAQNGDRAQARDLLAQLQNLLENLRAGQPGRMPPGESRAEQMMHGLQQLMQNQQQLLDRSFQAQRQQAQPGPSGEPNQMGEASGEPPDGPAQAQQLGKGGDMTAEAGRQEGLRRQLGDMMRRLGDALGAIPEPFGRAERAMHDAAGALRRDMPGQAIGPQTEALDQLQQAARDFARQLRQRYGNGSPDGAEFGSTDRSARDREGRDPLGRLPAGDGAYDEGDVKIPNDNTLAKSRHILDELRRRAGERDRPQIELDYINRLLQRF
ncbi:MAG TPA: TIGR02302 family protein [Stellaceae bacterium]|nr:TIGR02302 family protein [Stellaceae bacterium]